MSSSIKPIKGLVALVTGGASGLGLGTAKRLLLQGASVVICDLPSSAGKEIAEELGSQCVFVAADVTKEEDLKKALSIIEAKFHKLDIVVNCAGIYSPIKIYNFDSDQPHPMEDMMKMLSVNAAGTFNVIRLAVGLMSKNQPDADGQKGVIINTSSAAAYDGWTQVAAYAASKGAIVSMTLPLTRDLGSHGIRCCSIAPGMFDTPIVRRELKTQLREAVDKVPFPRRLGEPDEFAHLVQTIIENPMLNGCTIRLDGGLRPNVEIYQ